MDYRLNYEKLIVKNISRGLNKSKLEYYTEKHHIIPKALGGTDLPDNLVLLTAKEHYVAHHLLWKIHGLGPMAYAFHKFQFIDNMNRIQGKEYSKFKKLNATEYELLRIDFAKFVSTVLKGRILSEKRRKQLSEVGKGLVYWTNGIYDTKAKECPGDGWFKGRTNTQAMKGKHAGKKYFTNGIKTVRGYECPPGYWQGRPVIEAGRIKQRENQKGKPSPALGKTWKHSNEYVQVQKKRRWWNNGTENVFSLESPGQEWKHGQIKLKGKTYKWWNNGIQHTIAEECPPGWSKGMLKIKRNST